MGLSLEQHDDIFLLRNKILFDGEYDTISKYLEMEVFYEDIQMCVGITVLNLIISLFFKKWWVIKLS